MMRGIRGAITVDKNDRDTMIDATKELLGEMIERNNIEPEYVAHIWFTLTEDLNAAFPAEAARHFEGWQYVPVMCAREIPVPGGLQSCVRIMMTVETSKPQNEIQHVYLRDAVKLRPDLDLTKSRSSR